MYWNINYSNINLEFNKFLTFKMKPSEQQTKSEVNLLDEVVEEEKEILQNYFKLW